MTLALCFCKMTVEGIDSFHSVYVGSIPWQSKIPWRLEGRTYHVQHAIRRREDRHFCCDFSQFRLQSSLFLEEWHNSDQLAIVAKSEEHTHTRLMRDEQNHSNQHAVMCVCVCHVPVMQQQQQQHLNSTVVRRPESSPHWKLFLLLLPLPRQTRSPYPDPLEAHER